MTMIRKAAFAVAATFAASVLAPASVSAAETFNFLGSTNIGSGHGNVLTFTGNEGTKVEVSAYSTATGFNTATAVRWSDYGVGVTNRAWNDGHTIDNSNGIDYIVLQFDQVMTVSQLGLWVDGDSDLVWAAATTSTPFSGTLSLSNLNIFGSLNSATGSSSPTVQLRNVNAGGLSGNLFLIGAASSSNSNDSFKLRGLTATAIPAVPEPATWGMMIGGFAMAGAAMRRRKAATSVRFA